MFFGKLSNATQQNPTDANTKLLSHGLAHCKDFLRKLGFLPHSVSDKDYTHLSRHISTDKICLSKPLFARYVPSRYYFRIRYAIYMDGSPQHITQAFANVIRHETAWPLSHANQPSRKNKNSPSLFDAKRAAKFFGKLLHFDEIAPTQPDLHQPLGISAWTMRIWKTSTINQQRRKRQVFPLARVQDYEKPFLCMICIYIYVCVTCFCQNKWKKKRILAGARNLANLLQASVLTWRMDCPPRATAPSPHTKLKPRLRIDLLFHCPACVSSAWRTAAAWPSPSWARPTLGQCTKCVANKGTPLARASVVITITWKVSCLAYKESPMLTESKLMHKGERTPNPSNFWLMTSACINSSSLAPECSTSLWNSRLAYLSPVPRPPETGKNEAEDKT